MMELIKKEEVEKLLIEGKTYEQISTIYTRKYNVRGLSAANFRKYCKENNINKKTRWCKENVEKAVADSVAQVFTAKTPLYFIFGSQMNLPFQNLDFSYLNMC